MGKPKKGMEGKHLSMKREKDLKIAIKNEEAPCFCVLCAKKFHVSSQIILETHILNIHDKRSLLFRGIKILRCKCSDVKPRGKDGCHYHCYFCYKPCDHKIQLASHCILKHEVEPDEVHEWMAKSE